MSHFRFITGFQKKLIDFSLFIRIFIKLIQVFGLVQAFRALKKYSDNPKSILQTKVNRYLKINNELIAVSDMPPVNKKTFREYLLKDILWINENQPPVIVFAILCITSRCPYNCIYCYNSDQHSSHEKIELKVLENTIQELIHHGVQSIYLSGGEPLMRWDDLLMILRKFKTTGTRFWLLSTGWNLQIEKLNQLKAEGLTGVMISLDSMDRDQINSIKGSQNAYQDAMTAIKNAGQSGLITTIDCVMGKKLLEKENFHAFISHAQKAGAHFINCYTPRQMHQVLDKEYEHFTLNDFRKLKELVEENHNSVLFRQAPIAYSPDLWEAKRGCVGGKLFIYIDPEGNVRSCPFIRQSHGNIKTSPISDILTKISNTNSDQSCRTNQLLSEL